MGNNKNKPFTVKTIKPTREQAFKNAVANVEIEGYRLTDRQKELCAQVLDGKLSKQECIKILLNR